MSGDEKELQWRRAMEQKGHKPVLDGERLDIFVCDAGYHNGPGCSACGWSCCWHCDDLDDIPQCDTPATENEERR